MACAIPSLPPSLPEMLFSCEASSPGLPSGVADTRPSWAAEGQSAMASPNPPDGPAGLGDFTALRSFWGPRGQGAWHVCLAICHILGTIRGMDGDF